MSSTKDVTVLLLLLLLFTTGLCTGGRFRRQLIFSSSNNHQDVATTAITPIVVDNRPTAVTIPPFRDPNFAQMLSPDFLRCIQNCQTTGQYNPICGSDMQLYLNEAKFECARQCGADIEIVRRGACDGLFPMLKG